MDFGHGYSMSVVCAARVNLTADEEVLKAIIIICCGLSTSSTVRMTYPPNWETRASRVEDTMSTAWWCSFVKYIVALAFSCPGRSEELPNSLFLDKVFSSLLEMLLSSFFLDTIIGFLYSGTNSGDPSSPDGSALLFPPTEAVLLARSRFPINVMKFSTTPKKREGSMIAHTMATLPSIEGTMFMPCPSSTISTSRRAGNTRSQTEDLAGDT
mmetsp:Transcript_12508/g.34866  ORF Transcript_12508/g.34866 Transcript_12508/m.34866 type:complete len:212 (+) Transcript_12508:1528-2163(+)